MKSLTCIPSLFFIFSCGGQVAANKDTALELPAGNTVSTRFAAPEGYVTVKSAEGTFAFYLQNLPLKPPGTDVLLYNKNIKPHKVHAAVVDMEIGDKNLQQCADAVMRLRAEYLFHNGQKQDIGFHFTNGFLAKYAEWMKGNRMKVEGNDTYWVKQAEPDESYKSFRRYMDLIFTYAGTKSLEKELKPVPQASDIQIGDVFIQGGSPGHAVIVVNMARNGKGEKLFMLAQSYMPAQDIHILQNPNDSHISPWYSARFGDELVTPEWKFLARNLMRFP